MMRAGLMHYKRLIALIVVICLSAPSLTWAYDQKEVLRGLKGVKVVVENIPPDIERLGLSRRDIQTDVENKLRLVGIKVWPDYKPPSMTALYVNVHALNPTQARAIVVYSINIMLFENSYLKRDIGSVGDLKEVRAANWVKAMVGLTGANNIRDIRKKVEAEVDRFISDYKAVNH
jgi:hypothetical protein